MSLKKQLSPFNYPPAVAAAGAAILAAYPFVSVKSFALRDLQIANLAAYVLCLLFVSIPGRIDGQAQEMCKKGAVEQAMPDGKDSTFKNYYSPSKGRSLIAPAMWGFAIWGLIFSGEAAFCASMFFNSTVKMVLPKITVPFVAANLFQILWCVSFRPKYNKGWRKYVSAGMLGATSLMLSQVHLAITKGSLFSAARTAIVSGSLEGTKGSPYLVPMTVYFGWTAAAALLNLNGSVALSSRSSDDMVVALGWASAVAAAVLGVGVTLWTASPPFGLTMAWALTACFDGMRKRSNLATLNKGVGIQQVLCLIGAVACAASAAASFWNVDTVEKMQQKTS